MTLAPARPWQGEAHDKDGPCSGGPATWLPSHAGLLVRVRPGAADRRAPRAPDAVVVPTCRPDPQRRPGLRLALRLAARLGVPLVVLCSREAATPDALAALRRLVAEAGVEMLVLRLPATPGSLTRFDVDGLYLSTAYRRGGNREEDEPKVPLNDVGRKRNLALLLARAVGWRHLLFLDDDVFPRPWPRRLAGHGGRRWRMEPTLDRRTLSAAVRAVETGPARAVGWELRGFDDNSVLCRMRADLGRPQDQFIGGGALLVAVDEATPFFPAIYNEDWLFLLGYLAKNLPAPLASAGSVGQEPYPAYTPNRARAEEFGDILGEGMASAVGLPGGFWNTDKHFWAAALRARAAMRRQIEADLDRRGHPDAARMREALAAVKQVHSVLGTGGQGRAEQFAGYGPQWHADLSVWEKRLDEAHGLAPADLLASDEFTAREQPLAFGTLLPPARLVERWQAAAEFARPAAPLSRAGAGCG